MIFFTKAFPIRFDTGRWGLTGAVPVDLAYEYDSAEDLEIAMRSGSCIAHKIAEREGRLFKCRTWATRADALAAARAVLPEEKIGA